MNKKILTISIAIFGIALVIISQVLVNYCVPTEEEREGEDKNTYQYSGTVRGDYGLYQDHDLPYLTKGMQVKVHCSSVYSVYIYIYSKQDWDKYWFSATPQIEKLGSDVSFSFNILKSGTFVIVVGKAAGYLASSYQLTVTTTKTYTYTATIDEYPYKTIAPYVLYLGIALVAMGAIGTIIVMRKPKAPALPTPTTETPE